MVKPTAGWGDDGAPHLVQYYLIGERILGEKQLREAQEAQKKQEAMEQAHVYLN